MLVDSQPEAEKWAEGKRTGCGKQAQPPFLLKGSVVPLARIKGEGLLEEFNPDLLAVSLGSFSVAFLQSCT